MITFRQKGDFSKLTRFLERAKESVRLGDLDKYGREGVAALASATPVDTGRTANSWHYKIEQKQSSVSISFYNTNIQNGVPIAVILQYGHATRNGGWVSILLSSLFLTKLQMRHGRRLLSYEYNR